MKLTRPSHSGVISDRWYNLCLFWIETGMGGFDWLRCRVMHLVIELPSWDCRGSICTIKKEFPLLPVSFCFRSVCVRCGIDNLPVLQGNICHGTRVLHGNLSSHNGRVRCQEVWSCYRQEFGQGNWCTCGGVWHFWLMLVLVSYLHVCFGHRSAIMFSLEFYCSVLILAFHQLDC